MIEMSSQLTTRVLLGWLQTDSDYWFLSDASVGITDIWKNDRILLPCNSNSSDLWAP
jgi:hypothetical protein